MSTAGPPYGNVAKWSKKDKKALAEVTDASTLLPDYLKPNHVKIRDVQPNMRNLYFDAIVVDRRTPERSDGKDTYHQLLVGDETGSLFLYIYGLDGTLIPPSQIIQIQGGIYRNTMGVYMDKDNSKIVRIGEFTKNFRREPNFSICKWFPNPEEPDKLIMFLPGARIPKEVLDFAQTEQAQTILQGYQKVGGAQRAPPTHRRPKRQAPFSKS